MCVRTYARGCAHAHVRMGAVAQARHERTYVRTSSTHARTYVRAHACARVPWHAREARARPQSARAYVRACTLAHAQDKCAPSQSSHCHLWIKGGTHRAARHQFFCYVRPTYVSSRFACRRGIFRLPACFVDCQPEAMSLSGAKKRAIVLDAERVRSAHSTGITRVSIWDLGVSPLNRASARNMCII